MEEYGVGMMARSLAGHDKGKVYMVLDVKEPFVYLVDGKLRTLDHPKKKRIKHVQIDRHIPEWIENVIRETLAAHGIENAEVTAVDKGALDCTVRARVATALTRAAECHDYTWEVRQDV